MLTDAWTRFMSRFEGLSWEDVVGLDSIASLLAIPLEPRKSERGYNPREPASTDREPQAPRQGDG